MAAADRGTVSVVIARHTDEVCLGVSEAIERLQELLAQVPDEFRASAKISVEHEWDYDASTMEIRVWYDCPETDEEWAARLAKYEARARENAAFTQEVAEFLSAAEERYRTIECDPNKSTLDLD